MGKVIDITDKLSFDENPKILIKGELYEVNADARTMLEIMGAFANNDEAAGSLSAYEKLFSQKDREKIESLKLSFKDLMIIIETAMNLVQGEDEEGEAKPHTMT